MNNLNRILRHFFTVSAKASTKVFKAGAIVTFAALSLNAVTQEAEYYTWVDENGITNYAERNPEGINAVFVGKNRAFGRPGQQTFPNETPSTPDASPNSPPPTIDPDQLVEENAAALAAEVAETKRRNCDIGKNNLAQIRAFARIRVSDELGENRILTDAEKEAKAEQARQVIRENCSG